MDGLFRHVHQPDRRGLVLRPDKSWEGGRASAFSSPIWVPEESCYKWVYNPNHKDWSGLATSKDGIHWEKPCLGIMEFDDSRQNNLISDRRIRKVVHDPDDPDPRRRFKGLANKKPVTSPDLIYWHDDGGTDLPGGDSGSLTYDEEKGRFLAPVKISDPDGDSYRQFEIVTSEDFREWSEARFFFGADDDDQRIALERIRSWLSDPGRPRPLFVEPPPQLGWSPPPEMRKLPKRRHSWNAQCNNISIFPYQGIYIALITMLYPTGSYIPGHQNTTGFFMVEIASTRDLRTWNRLRTPFLEPARLDRGVIDNYERMLVQPVNRPLERDDQLWFYYTGGKEHQGFRDSRYGPGRYSSYMDGEPRAPGSLSELERADLEIGQSALYLATLRLDGFVSLSAGSDGGRLLTKSLIFVEGELHLNAEIEGSITMELLDESGSRIGVSEPVTGDDVNLLVSWGEGFHPEDINSPICLDIQLKDASLYSIWTEPRDNG